ncbi:MAG: DUF222 domain-containing protein [Streptosporangiales bacterium]|nr:DUF222 domain-containing protein [Streptosporangiales bacterium]
MPEAVDQVTREAAEEHLLGAARDWDPNAVSKRATHLEAVLDPDGLLVTEAEQRQQREVSLSRDLHGRYRLYGRLDAEAANTLKLALDPLARPDPPPGERDPRTAGQRRADALVVIASWSLRHKKMPSPGGQRPHVLVTSTLAELRAKAGTATLNNGELVSVETALKNACDADVSLAVFDHRGALLHYGRDKRTAAPDLRRALLARDRGCVHPGCDVPPVYLHAHHLDHWVHGGETSIETMGMWCGRHHKLQHGGGWHAVMIDGRPHVIPPRWLDTDQKPRRNHIHDPP